MVGAVAREVADREGGRRLTRRVVVAAQVDAERHDRYAVARNAEVACHRLHVVVAHADEGVDVGGLLPDERDGLAPPRLGQTLEEHVLTLQRAAYWPSQGSTEGRGERDEQTVREVH